MGRRRQTLVLAISVNAALLLGCINGSLLGSKTPDKNKPVPRVTATAGTAPSTPNPGEFGRAVQNLKTSFTSLAKASGAAIDAISADDERAIGQAASINIIQQSGGLVLEEGLIKYVNAVANHIGQQGQRVVTGKDGVARINSRRFFVGVLADDSMNAYAMPGGYILLTRGLLQNLSCESDLAWVLGHEIAHIDNEDGLKALKLAVGGSAFGKELLQFGATKPEGETVTFKNPAFFAKVADKLTEISFNFGLGREDERNADSQGLSYSTVAGYDAQGAKRVLELLATNPTKRKIFATHDEPAVRLQLLNKQIGGLTVGKLGIERFDRGCIQRLDAARASSASASVPTPAPAP